MTGRPCVVCTRPDRDEINAALLRHEAGFRSLASRFGGMSHASLRRHLTTHLGVAVAQSLELLAEARKAGDLRTTLAAIRESWGNIESYSRIGVLGEVEARLAALEAAQEWQEGSA